MSIVNRLLRAVSTISIRLALLGCTLAGVLGTFDRALGSEVDCRFRAETETAQIHILAKGKTWWTGTIEKSQTKTIAIPDGPFTVISKLYNANLKTTTDLRTDTHTRLCREQVVLNVPMFSEPKDH
ncbi:MAG TPA: hypothetical protein VFQ02_05250 [Nitrospira sp.]|nr:hypothetical protein [Nitrospira sp.]